MWIYKNLLLRDRITINLTLSACFALKQKPFKKKFKKNKAKCNTLTFFVTNAIEILLKQNETYV